MIRDLQEANDMLEGAVNQRNAAQNEAIQLAAAIKARDRRIADLEAKLAQKTDEPELPFKMALVPKPE